MQPHSFLSLGPGEQPALAVVVDTEEEFEWGAGFLRKNDSVDAMAEIGAFQEVCDEFGIVPHYAIDYPVASRPEGFRDLRRFAEEGRAEIGAHLHPWVNPPFDRDADPPESYPGNLPEPVEKAKLETLVQAIRDNLGVDPRAYKAGRYGLGPHSPAILEELGFEVDLSICPRVDLGADGGPDFRNRSARPFWFGREGTLLALPVSAGWVGGLAGVGPWMGRLAHSSWGKAASVPAVLSRARLLERLRLSPEGMDAAQHRRLARALVRRRVPILTFSFHSPSLKPGCTAYVRTDEERAAFLESCRSFFRFFRDELGGRFTSPLAWKRERDGSARTAETSEPVAP